MISELEIIRAQTKEKEAYKGPETILLLFVLFLERFATRIMNSKIGFWPLYDTKDDYLFHRSYVLGPTKGK